MDSSSRGPGQMQFGKRGSCLGLGVEGSQVRDESVLTALGSGVPYGLPSRPYQLCSRAPGTERSLFELSAVERQSDAAHESHLVFSNRREHTGEAKATSASFASPALSVCCE